MNINTCKRWLLVLCVVDLEDFTAIEWIFNYLQRPIYVWSNESGRIIDKQECEFEREPFHLALGLNHFQPMEKLNQSIPIIIPRENKDIKINNLESNVSYKKNLIDSEKTWMQQMPLESSMHKPNSIDSEKTWMQQMPLESSMHKPNSIDQVV
jgi:hypothetical protein